MAKRERQTAMFEQERITEIEDAADVFDEKRTLIAGLVGERDDAEEALGKIIKKYADKVSKEKGKKGAPMLVYKRGDYNCSAREGKTTINVKIAKASKPDGSLPEASE